MLWKQMQQADQHALRCTCKAVRDASTPWISKLCIIFEPPAHLHGQQPTELTKEEALLQAEAQLTLFPSVATITSVQLLFEAPVPRMLSDLFISAACAYGCTLLTRG